MVFLIFTIKEFIQELKSPIISRSILCYGIWLVPLLLLLYMNLKISLSRRNTSIASLLTWSISIISYYMFLAIDLMFIGRESRMEMHISNYLDPYFWSNWKSVFYGQVFRWNY